MKKIDKSFEKILSKHPFGSQINKGRLAKVLWSFYYPKNKNIWLITEGEKDERGKWNLYGYFFIAGKWIWACTTLNSLLNDAIQDFDVLGKDLVADYIY